MWVEKKIENFSEDPVNFKNYIWNIVNGTKTSESENSKENFNNKKNWGSRELKNYIWNIANGIKTSESENNNENFNNKKTKKDLCILPQNVSRKKYENLKCKISLRKKGKYQS